MEQTGEQQTSYTDLVAQLRNQVGINCGSVPIKPPKTIEDIRLLRIFINIVRQAESDYLSKRSTPEDRQYAIRTLFGVQLSPLSGVCRILGIDRHAAKLKLLEWELSGRTGDPIFGYMIKPKSLERFERGQALAVPKF